MSTWNVQPPVGGLATLRTEDAPDAGSLEAANANFTSEAKAWDTPATEVQVHADAPAEVIRKQGQDVP